MKRKQIFTTLACLFVWGGAALSISLYVGTVEGKVTDPKASTLKGVHVTLAPADPDKKTPAPTACEALRKVKGSQTATTGPNGKYKFVAVRPGTYDVCYELEGYISVRKRAEIKQAVINVLDATLQESILPQTQTHPQ